MSKNSAATTEMSLQEQIEKLADELGVLKEVRAASDQLGVLRQRFRQLDSDTQDFYKGQGWVPNSILEPVNN